MPITDALAGSGFALVPDALAASACESLAAAMPAPRTILGSREAGTRIRLDEAGALHELARSPAIRVVIEPILGEGAFVVRALLFDKAPSANWRVPWHRDRTIAVRERIDAPGYGPWSIKDGIPHVQPPRAVLDGMLALRLHLDDCSAADGPLRVIPGSHRDEVLDEPAVPVRPDVICVARLGSLLLLRPLLLHASSPAQRPGRRRVLHLELAAAELAPGIEWRERVAVAPGGRPTPS
jgi:ectoine hydroxylase-related dioxygenase (phytanoyl-CoA dioxygenase family)